MRDGAALSALQSTGAMAIEMPIPMKHYWMGQDIEELPREKLVEVIGHLSERIEQLQQTFSATVKIHELSILLAARPWAKASRKR